MIGYLREHTSVRAQRQESSSKGLGKNGGLIRRIWACPSHGEMWPGLRNQKNRDPRAGRTPSSSDSCFFVYALASCTSSLCGSVAGTSGSQGRTRGPCLPCLCTLCDGFCCRRDRFLRFPLQNYWGRRGLSWMGSAVPPWASQLWPGASHPV